MTDAKRKPRPRIVFVANCVYGDHVAGGDIHFFHMAQAAIEAGYEVHFFGGQALISHLEKRQGIAAGANSAPTAKSFRRNQYRIVFGTTPPAAELRGTVFANTCQPAQNPTQRYRLRGHGLLVRRVAGHFQSRAEKLMILGMDAPTFREIIFRLRPDVTASRLNSIYYWLSQNLSLWLFLLLGNKRLFYVHPDMKPRLLTMGYREDEIIFISNGMNLKAAAQVPPQKKEYDVVWLGRVHRQKGIDDLLATLAMLSREIKNFRAVLVGRLDELAPRLAELNLSPFVTLTGLVSEEEKFRLFKASRVFLMPSRQESWGIVIAEALACDVPVVAYDLPAYRPIFGGLIDYVPSFDFEIFKSKSLGAIEKARRGEMVLDAPRTGVAEIRTLVGSGRKPLRHHAQDILGTLQQLRVLLEIAHRAPNTFFDGRFRLPAEAFDF